MSLVDQRSYDGVGERRDLGGNQIVHDDFDRIHLRSRNVAHRRSGLLGILDFARDSLATERIIPADRGRRVTARRRRDRAGDHDTWAGHGRLHATAKLGDVWQRIARRSDGGDAMADEAGQHLWQSCPLVVSQRGLIDNVAGDEQVHVRVDESRDHGPSAKIDDARLRSAKPPYVLVAADGADALAFESDGFSSWPCRIRCQDFCPHEDQIDLTGLSICRCESCR